MTPSDPFEKVFDNPNSGFKSVFDEDGSDNTLQGRFSDLQPGPSGDGRPATDEMTIYVSETDGPPPELDELNGALDEGWYIADLSLGLRKEEGSSSRVPCFIVSLEREKPPSLFEIGAK